MAINVQAKSKTCEKLYFCTVLCEKSLYYLTKGLGPLLGILQTREACKFELIKILSPHKNIGKIKKVRLSFKQDLMKVKLRF